jgi:malectin (di-glucose binding ER protein)
MLLVARRILALVLASPFLGSCSLLEPLDALQRASDSPEGGVPDALDDADLGDAPSFGDAAIARGDAVSPEASTRDGSGPADAEPGDAAGPSGTVIRIACGRFTSYTDHAGSYWAADMDFIGGDVATHSPTIAIANTLDGILYNSQRYGDAMGQRVPFMYRFTVTPGTYDVTLKFAETYDTEVGQRRFSVLINGTQVLSAFDIFLAAGGADIAFDQRFAADAPSGTITIEFDPGDADFPKVDAIEVVPR